jgi:hypothetical protein
MPVRRFDFLGPVHKLETTVQGFVRVDARLTRTGIFTYHQDGRPIRELRLPEEVFRAESLRSIAGAPVTDLHPEAFITPDNAKALSVGFAGEDIVAEGTFVSARLTITDATAIAGLKNGTRKEISLGYACDVDFTPGIHEGQHYDAIQRNIVVNHIALGPPGWGRAGREVALKLDSTDAMQITGGGTNVDETTSSSTPKTTITLNGIEFEVSEELKKAILEELQRREGKEERGEGRMDALEKELAKERQLRAQAQDPRVLESRLKDRLQLIQQCQRVLGDARLDGKNDRELKMLVIRKDNPELNLADKKEAYIDGMFEAVVANYSKRNDSLASAHIAANGTESGYSIDAVIKKWNQDARDMWKRPLASQS